MLAVGQRESNKNLGAELIDKHGKKFPVAAGKELGELWWGHIRGASPCKQLECTEMLLLFLDGKDFLGR